MLATVVRVEGPASAKAGDKAVITADGRLRGWIGGSCSEPLVRREALSALSEATPRLVRIVPAHAARVRRRPGELTLATTCPSGGSLDIFIEPQLPKPLLLVFGESPAALTLTSLAEMIGFRAGAVSQAELGSVTASGADVWCVVATMGHFDEDALETALAFPEAEVALVASRRRGAAVLDVLRGRGVPEETLARVRTPAGRARGTTQEEIALLALAELVAERGRQRARGPERMETAPLFATDPVCGMAVEIKPGAISATRESSTYYFCSEECRDRFLATAPA